MIDVKAVPDLARVGEIAAIEPKLRNLWITHAYERLSTAFCALVAPGNANWTTWGCWASKEAGGYIRGEEIPGLFRRSVEAHEGVRGHLHRFTSALREVVHDVTHPVDAVLDLSGRIVTDITALIGHGNKVVFQELGGSFVLFLDAFGDGDLSERRLDELLAHYSTGPSEPDLITLDRESGVVTNQTQGGQEWMRGMLRSYHRAALAETPRDKAQMIYLGNAYGSLHEQMRLQHYIRSALDTPVHDLVPELLLRHVEDAGAHRHGEVHRLVDRFAVMIAHQVEEAFEHAATSVQMHMRLPGESMRMGGDVLARDGENLWPDDLDTLDAPELRELITPFVPGDELDGSLAGALHRRADGTGARDWADFDGRMRFVLALFRSRQQEPALFGRPFSDQQLAQMAAGEMPDGPL